ncbi:hypothetical protein Y032_0702g1662 [Ancylostoma ceylanicum]|nr:hypothetical protein Y032_0702g1662 [Ancylostoma ceylanicum]
MRSAPAKNRRLEILMQRELELLLEPQVAAPPHFLAFRRGAGWYKSWDICALQAGLSTSPVLLTWEGFPAIVYLLLNRTIQREALSLLRLHRAPNLRPLQHSVSRAPITDS